MVYCASNTGSPQTLERMRKPGLHTLCKCRGLTFEGLAIRDANPPGATGHPPVRTGADKGACWRTDSTRIGIAGVRHAIEFYLTGIASGGSVRKPASERLTSGSAGVIHASCRTARLCRQSRGQQRRKTGRSGVTQSAIYDTMPKTGYIRAVLTLVDERIVLKSGP
ncbi:hypothetical protein KCP74_18800 [Salmonella enterica subsp. enterica]|nr:hypothetical protein KCP74_18800 [Salmonella enterica subsp. enterica]